MINMEPEFIGAIFALIFVSISVIVGLTLIAKYFKSKDVKLLYVGIAWIIIVESWMPSAVNLIYMLINPNGLSLEARVLIGNIAIPLGVVLWTMVITELVFEKYKKILLIVLSITGIIFEIILFTGIFINLEFIVDIKSHPLNTSYSLIMIVFQIIFSVYTLATGLAFSAKSIKHLNPEIKLRGKLLFLAFICFLIGAILGIFEQFILGNIILIPSSIFFYFGYILPRFLKNKFIK